MDHSKNVQAQIDARGVTQISVSNLTPESTSKLMMLLSLFEVLKYILQMPC